MRDTIEVGSAPAKKLLIAFAGVFVAALMYFVPGVAWAGPCEKGFDHSEHEVKAGETVSKIAIVNGVSQGSIERSNPGLKPNLIRPGQTIDICKEKPGSAQPRAKSCGGGRTIGFHVVKKGDTLSGIASRYNVSQDAIVKRNAELRSSQSNLKIGQQLQICADPRRAKASKTCDMKTPVHTHVVLPGEHVSQIAGRYGVRRRDLYRLNGKLAQNPNMIRPGQAIRVCPNIPPREQIKLTHAVQSGQNLGTIAKMYGLTVRELVGYQRGRLDEKANLRVGQELTVWREGKSLPGFGGYDDDKGVLKSGVQLPPGKHYVVKSPGNAWGTSKTIRLLQTSIAGYRGRHGGPKVHIGDISRRGGGKFPPHVSHQHGRDIDIGYVLKGEDANETRFVSARKQNLDLNRSWKLIKSFLDTNQVKYIFMDWQVQKMLYEHLVDNGVSKTTLDELFQYPRRRSHGVIRQSPGHRNHFHVRFYE